MEIINDSLPDVRVMFNTLSNILKKRSQKEWKMLGSSRNRMNHLDILKE